MEGGMTVSKWGDFRVEVKVGDRSYRDEGENEVEGCGKEGMTIPNDCAIRPS